MSDTTRPARWRTAANAVGLVLLLAMVVCVRLIVARVGIAGDPFTFVYGFVAPAAYLIPGMVLLFRRRWHPVGWLLCLMAVGITSAFANDWGRIRVGGPWMVWYADVIQGSLFWFVVVALLVVFPDGLSTRAPRRRRLGWAVLVVGAVAAAIELFATEVRDAGGGLVPSPFPITFVPITVVDNITVSIEFVALLVAFVDMILRYRSSHDAARRQYRWVLSAIVFLIVALLVGLAGSALGGDDNGSWWIPILFAYLALPASFMVAILRYRLYEIDRVVSRTVTYAVVMVVLIGMYAAAVGLLTLVLPMSSDVAVAAATLVVAGAFSPLRRRVRRGVERRFNRTRFDAEREVEGFVRRLRGRTDLLEVESDLAAVVDRTLQPTAVTLWLRH
jgi:hypothetical protein